VGEITYSNDERWNHRQITEVSQVTRSALVERKLQCTIIESRTYSTDLSLWAVYNTSLILSAHISFL